ncbi:hypothetical protein POM88_008166 [Heracleum sosnowskyi]|uniref:DUF674 family protein n=1 Tax=Heracleum sosnowskyi TaxID=360622 RepID=A0AAD8J6S4_9APIA|nr:hypothetical protein POM88_008166 [Heracleum sosnowskyi]
MAPSNIQIPVKVLVHKQEERVLFAEANSDFVDILFSFLTMPMGTIVRLLSNQSDSSQPPAIGSFTNLYRSMSNLEPKYFATQACRDVLLKTTNSAYAECRKLKINIDDIKPGFYICEDLNCSSNHLSFYRNVKCEKCSKFLNWIVCYSGSLLCHTTVGGQGVFVSTTASFVITDDLCVNPNIPASTFAILYNSGFTDFGAFEEKTFNIGFTEILDLLKYSFLSKTPLTALFLGKNNVMRDKSVHTINRPVSIHGIDSFKKMTVKVLVQKSNNKILLAFSSKDFVDFLFNLLTIPLGRVIGLLSEFYAPALCVENIYRSVSDLNVAEYFKSKEMRDMLLCPQLVMLHKWFSQLFPVKEEIIQKFYLYKKYTPPGQCYYEPPYLTRNPSSATRELKLASPLCDGVLLSGSTMFMLTDDLVVTPLSSMSCIKYLQSRNVSPIDTEEHVIDVGMKEAVNLLRASLLSNSVLTSGLKHLIQIKPKTERLMKKPKVEN